MHFCFLGCFFICFFSPSSFSESPLSLRHFKFTENSIDSVSLFFSIFSLFFFAIVDDADCFAVVVVVTVVTVGTVVAVIGFVIWFFVGFLTEVFFFSSLLYHRHNLTLVFQSVGNGRKHPSVQTHGENIITVRCPICGFGFGDILNVSIFT